MAVAKQKGWETFKILKDGTVIALQEIDELGMPVYYITYTNVLAAATTNTQKLYEGGTLGLSLSGKGIPTGKMAIWDGGAVLTTHVELNGRVRMRDNSTTVSNHATHVAGTIMARGVYAPARGMAYELPDLLAFDFNNDRAEMSANAAELLLSNHSYGSISGWYYNSDVSPARWEFWGAPNEMEDYRFGYYNSTASDWDAICYYAPYYLPVKSAGNNRNVNGPAVGQAYYRYNNAGVMSLAGPRPAGISSNNGYDIIPTYGTAKNILTVGAIYALAGGSTGPASIQISNFSSWGPTDDGRIKPDLVADGVSVTSSGSSSSTSYSTLSGTSMSSPNVSGTLLLLQELYQQRYGSFMRASTLKALAIGTASEAGAFPGPDYIYGWGLLNAEAAARAILEKESLSLIHEQELSQGAVVRIPIVASGREPIVATLCWTDPEATPVATASALNNGTLRLINDLDLRIEEAAQSHLPWVLNPASPAAAATRGDNFRDNVEQVVIDHPVPGRTYTLTIRHKGTLARGGQVFSLVATGVGGSPYCSSGPERSDDSKIIGMQMAGVQYQAANGCTDYRYISSTAIPLEKGKTYPLEIELGTCGTAIPKSAKVFIDWNGDGDFDDEHELIGSSPVISGSGKSLWQVPVPSQVVENSYTVMRVVLVETNRPELIEACGTYAKGETLDHRILLLPPSKDASLSQIELPVGEICAEPLQKITVSIKNNGTQPIEQVPLIAEIKESGQLIARLSDTFETSLLPRQEATFTFSSTFITSPAKNYHIAVHTGLLDDQDRGNDTLSVNIRTKAAPNTNESEAYYCEDIAAYRLLTKPDGTAIPFWYAQKNDLLPIAFGEQTAVALNKTGTFYLGLNDFKASIGPKSKMELGEGGYNQFTPAININVLVPLTLKRARLYIGHPGQLKLNVVNKSGVIVSSRTLQVAATRSTAVAGASANDLSDFGKVYELNLDFPEAGTYSLQIEYLEGVTLFRNNAGATQYPYESAHQLFSITGNTATEANNPNYYRTFYYYLYDLEINSFGCSTEERIAVEVAQPRITYSQGILSSTYLSNQWYLNGQKIPNAMASEFRPTENGKYFVEVLLNGCLSRSEEWIVSDIQPAPSSSPIRLKVYPVPARDELHFSFLVDVASHVKIQLSNAIGKTYLTEEKTAYQGSYLQTFNVAHLPAGVYVLTVFIDQKRYSQKVIIVK